MLPFPLQIPPDLLLRLLHLFMEHAGRDTEGTMKLLGKETKYMNHIQIVCHVSFLIFVIFTGALFFGGGDLLLIFFALTKVYLRVFRPVPHLRTPMLRPNPRF